MHLIVLSELVRDVSPRFIPRSRFGRCSIYIRPWVPVWMSDPRIVRFEATPTNITSGESSTLSWTTEGATSVSIRGVGTNLPTSGSRVVSPTVTTTYTLTATGADGRTVTAPVIVTVGGGASRILQFSLNPTTVDPGGSSQLCWQVEGATTVTITPGIGTVAATGCQTVLPSATTVYTLTATGPLEHWPV